jgi:tetrahydromethanopterin S-methyltransferase subunit C
LSRIIARDLAAYEVGTGIPALGYPVGTEGTQAMRITCLIFDLPAIARVYVITIRQKSPGNVSRALRAKNVAVFVDPTATANEVHGTLRAVVQLRRE